MIEIQLTQNQVALIDDNDYELVSQYNWQALYNRSTKSYYAVTKIPHPDGGYYTRPSGKRESRRKTLFMHNLILDRKGIDHKFHDTLDNRRSNLRPATAAQNNANQRIQSNNKSGYIGVTWHNSTGRWWAHIRKSDRLVYSEFFDDPIIAAFARDEAAREHFGAFACPNFTFTPDNTMPRVWEEPVTT